MKKILPVYCLLGEDGYRKREFLAGLKRRLLSGDDNSLNYEYFLAEETDPARVLDAARTPAWDLFSGRGGGDKPVRLVVVDGAEAFSDAQWQLLGDYFAVPDPASCLVFLVKREKKKWPGRKFVPEKYLVDHPPLKKGQLLEWIGKEAARRGLRLSRKQVDRCALAAGNDLGSLAGGLEILALYQGGGGEVSDRALEEVIAVGHEGSVFTLTELAAARKAGEALVLLNHLLDQGEPPLRIFSLIAGSVRKLWLGVDAWERTGDSRAALEAAGVRFYPEQFLRQVKNLSAAEIPFWYRRLVETDWALKGGEKDARLALERFLLDLAGARTISGKVEQSDPA